MSLTITIRQVRNPWIFDVPYVASKQITFPNNSNDTYVDLSDLGFGEPGQSFVAFIFGLHSLEFVNPVEEEEFRVASLREVLTYDAMLGPILTVVDYEDFRDSFIWNRQAKKRRNAERVTNLKWGLMHPWSCIASAMERLLKESPAK